jgi:hypothetical protein
MGETLVLAIDSLECHHFYIEYCQVSGLACVKISSQYLNSSWSYKRSKLKVRFFSAEIFSFFALVHTL